jgi:uncharacterized membrane protein
MFLDRLKRFKHGPRDDRAKSALKTVSRRVLASTDTLIISWILTGNFKIASSIMSVEIVSKMFLYYGHERIWARFL